LREHPLLGPAARRATWVTDAEGNRCPPDGWAVVVGAGPRAGAVHLHPSRRATAPEWTWAGAHALLHLAFEHADERHLSGWSAAAGLPAGRAGAGFARPWPVAACLAVNRFLARLRIGSPPPGLGHPTAHDHRVAVAGAEEECARWFRTEGVPPELGDVGVGGPHGDLAHARPGAAVGGSRPSTSATWPELLAAGLADAVAAAVDVAGGALDDLSGRRRASTAWRRALSWFVTAHPLLGGLAGGFTLVEDADVVRAHGIAVAAVSPVGGELYVNPQADLTDDERRFVIAHELLHAALRHDSRAGGRDPWLWNVACDFVINDWLVQLEVGAPPAGALHDAALRGLSAEEVYDRIATDRRRFRRLATLRGVGLVDVLPGRLPVPGGPAAAVDLDEFYRRSLADGLARHASADRGLLPAGLVEEIRALSHPPVPWDVRLARWFDERFPPLERRRTYARASRRQSASPDIPRPGRRAPDEDAQARTFGVVLDTSGSMDPLLLGTGLGAIASYAVARDVSRVRVVFCDAAAHDNGWMDPLEIASRVRVRGRGGTVLQPGVDLIEQAADFPPDGPLLVVTDGACDRVSVRRDHAFLVPAGARLPFVPRGPVFRMV